MSLQSSTHRLCIYCRRLEPANEPCPNVSQRKTNASDISTVTKSASLPSGLSREDDQLIRSLQTHPSSLCERCSDYDILNVFRKSKPLDQIQRTEHDRVDEALYAANMAPYRLNLGRPSSVLLIPSCQFCRLLYCIIPRDETSDEEDLLLEPYRAYIRQPLWENFPHEFKDRCAVYIGLASSRSLFAPVSVGLRAGDGPIRYPMMTGPAICLDTKSSPPERNMYVSRRLESVLDLSILLEPLEHCEKHHGDYCYSDKPAELLKTKMIDVEKRMVVKCPEKCDYIALSYVWGGVQPVEGALEKRCLPQTIEDAITVTKALGRRYLWVDALCIDQSAHPSPEVLKEKIQQLNMMAIIYGCATVTIVALHGTNSNAGLPGVSVPRPAQVGETIDGHTLLTIPQDIFVARENAGWSNRAWTLQEELLSRRMLQFTESEVDFSCLRGSVWEGIDVDTARKDHTPVHGAQSLLQMLNREQPPPNADTEDSSDGKMRFFDGILQSYTSRRMTNESDSLNAFLGMLAGFQRRMFPEGFMHGLPLQSHPAALGWMHDRLSKPKPRAMFPSWSWTGWEGTAVIPRDILNFFDGDRHSAMDVDLEVHIVSLNDKELTVEGWVADLDIRTDPFSEVFVPEYEDSVASVMEGNSVHNNTIPTGHYTCLVVQRQCEKNSSRNPPRQKAFLVVLELDGDVAQRRTLVTVTLFARYDFTQVKMERRIIRLA